jgi:hypothetical protein
LVVVSGSARVFEDVMLGAIACFFFGDCQAAQVVVFYQLPASFLQVSSSSTGKGN